MIRTSLALVLLAACTDDSVFEDEGDDTAEATQDLATATSSKALYFTIWCGDRLERAETVAYNNSNEPNTFKRTWLHADGMEYALWETVGPHLQYGFGRTAWGLERLTFSGAHVDRLAVRVKRNYCL